MRFKDCTHSWHLSSYSSSLTLFRSTSKESMPQASVHHSDCCHCRGGHHNGFHFRCPEQAYIPEVQGTTAIYHIFLKPKTNVAVCRHYNQTRQNSTWTDFHILDLFLILQYGIVLDAGSSHTSVFIYEWPAEKENNTGMVRQTHTCGVKGTWPLIYSFEYFSLLAFYPKKCSEDTVLLLWQLLDCGMICFCPLDRPLQFLFFLVAS